MNPMQMNANRTARLVREASTPVYSTSTPAPKPREHMVVIEWEHIHGGRHWSKPFPHNTVDAEVEALSSQYAISDLDHALACWCGGRVNIWE